LSNADQNQMPETDSSGFKSWSDLVDRIQFGDTSATEDMYRMFFAGIRFLIHRQLGSEDLDEKVHNVLVIVTQAIRSGELREPSRLMGYVHGVVRGIVASGIGSAVGTHRTRAYGNSNELVSDQPPNPVPDAMERMGMATRVLKSTSHRDREVLTRWYLNEESAEAICSGMGLSETQFLLIKSQAKARFGELGERWVAIHTAVATSA